MHPVVGRAGIFLGKTADEGSVFHTGNVNGIGPGQVAVGTFLRVELSECSTLDEKFAEAVILLLGAVAPVDPLRLTELSNLLYPLQELLVVRHIITHSRILPLFLYTNGIIRCADCGVALDCQICLNFVQETDCHNKLKFYSNLNIIS
jgi:hypothetical protein